MPSSERLAGRAAIVTGAGNGNGAAIARAYTREGAGVVCADLDGDAAERVAAEIGAGGGAARALRMDHTVAADCAAAVQLARTAFGGLDVLVNNAGIAILGTALDLDEDDFVRQLRINLVGPYLMTRAALPLMIDRGGGAIVMIASAAGLRPQPAGVAYITSKHGLVGMTKALAVDYAPHGIRVNAICPALIQTRIADQYMEDRARLYEISREEVVAQVNEQFPLGRLGQPEDVAEIAVHFASAESQWVTGTTYLLDGGQSLLGAQRAAKASEGPRSR